MRSPSPDPNPTDPTDDIVEPERRPTLRPEPPRTSQLPPPHTPNKSDENDNTALRPPKDFSKKEP